MSSLVYFLLSFLIFCNEVLGKRLGRSICTEEQKLSNAFSWREQTDSKGRRKRPASNCPRTDFYQTVVDSSAECGVKKAHIMVIGGNKGFDCVGWSRMYSNIPRNDANWIPNSKDWMQLAKEIVFRTKGNKVRVRCGACGQCNTDYPSPSASAPPLSIEQPKISCVEPLPVNYEVLIEAANTKPWSTSSGLEPLQFAALLDTSPVTALFPSNESVGMGFGIELIGVAANPHSRWAKREVPITLVTVDDLVFNTNDNVHNTTDDLNEGSTHLNNHDHIPTILTIDTEGYDAHVLLGAARTLSSGHVAYLEFEYHSYPPWSSFSLAWIIAYLSNLQYDCYFIGNKGEAWKVTGCEQDTPEFFRFKDWSNLACASRLPKKPHTCWHDAIEKQVTVTAANAATKKRNAEVAATATPTPTTATATAATTTATT